MGIQHIEDSDMIPGYTIPATSGRQRPRKRSSMAFLEVFSAKKWALYNCIGEVFLFAFNLQCSQSSNSALFLYAPCMYSIFSYNTGGLLGQILVNVPFMEHMRIVDSRFTFTSDCSDWIVLFVLTLSY